MAKKNNIFTPESKRDEAYWDNILKEAMDELKRVTNTLKSRRARYKDTAVKLSESATDISAIKAEYSEFRKKSSTIEEKREMIEKVRDVYNRKRQILLGHEKSADEWRRKGREKARAAREGERDVAGAMSGKTAQQLYAYVVDSLGGDKSGLEIYDSDDILEAADELIENGNLITKDRLEEAIREIDERRGGLGEAFDTLADIFG